MSGDGRLFVDFFVYLAFLAVKQAISKKQDLSRPIASGKQGTKMNSEQLGLTGKWFNGVGGQDLTDLMPHMSKKLTGFTPNKSKYFTDLTPHRSKNLPSLTPHRSKYLTGLIFHRCKHLTSLFFSPSPYCFFHHHRQWHYPIFTHGASGN
jgi:hypothetical protein